MAKTKAKKSNKLQCKCKVCPLTGILLILTIGLAIFSDYLFCNRKTNEEKKRLQAFETILESDTHKMIQSFQGKKNIDSEATETGLTAEGDIYVKFKYIEFEDDEMLIPSYINTGTLYYPCGTISEVDGKVIGSDTARRCGKHIDLDENKKEYSEEIKNKAREYSQKTDVIAIKREAIYNSIKVYNGLGWDFDFDKMTEEQSNTLKTLGDEEAALDEEYIREVDDKLWNYL